MILIRDMFGIDKKALKIEAAHNSFKKKSQLCKSRFKISHTALLLADNLKAAYSERKVSPSLFGLKSCQI